MTAEDDPAEILKASARIIIEGFTALGLLPEGYRFPAVEQEPPKRIVVLTARYATFVQWCHDRGLNPRDRNVVQVSCMTDVYRIRGTDHFEVHWLYDWDEIPHYDKVYAYIQYRMAIGTATERTDT